MIRRALASSLAKPAQGVTNDQLAPVLERLSKSSARALVANGSACFAWGVGQKLITANPFTTILAGRAMTKRDRVLSDRELAAVWNASLKETTAYGPIVRTLLLTAQRRQEVACMRWDELSNNFETWTIPGARTKNRLATIVPLSPVVRDIIRRMPRSSSKLVFSGEDSRAFGNWSKAKVALDEASGVTGWRLHDLRRTASTGFQVLGVRFEVNEAILNHRSGSRGGIAGIYQRHEWNAEKAIALEAWSEHVIKVCNPNAQGKTAQRRAESAREGNTP